MAAAAVPRAAARVQVMKVLKQMMMRLSIAGALLTLAAGIMPASAQDTLKVMTWNVLAYDGTSTATGRNESYKTVVVYAAPDVVAVQEVKNSTAAVAFAQGVMIPLGYTLAIPFNAGPDSNNLFFYKAGKVDYLGTTYYNTTLRHIDRYTVKDKVSGDTLHVYSVHLKAGSDAAAATQRQGEVDVLRGATNALPSGTNFIVLGDFNIYSSVEGAYVRLLAEPENGKFIDPVTMISLNPWAVSTNRALHTQSSHSTQSGIFTGGGLDDRFDLILHSKAIADPGGITYIAGSQIPIGNDGSHFNKAVNDGTNGAVSQAVADALFNASDHLPVVARYLCSGTTGVERVDGTPAAFALAANYPNPFNPATTITFSLERRMAVSLGIYDALGRLVARPFAGTLDAGTHRVRWNAAGCVSGAYYCRLEAEGMVRTRAMMLTR